MVYGHVNNMNANKLNDIEIASSIVRTEYFGHKKEQLKQNKIDKEQM